MIIDIIENIEIFLPKFVIKNNNKNIFPADDSELSTDSTDSENGGGFGDSINNYLVEVAAIEFITHEFENDKWIVKSCENEKCGYDLLCIKGDLQKHVEVKGVRGSQISFIITKREVEQSQKDEFFQLCVVTSALSKPLKHAFTGKEFNKLFLRTIISYFAQLIIVGE